MPPRLFLPVCLLALTGCVTYVAPRDMEVASSAALSVGIGRHLELHIPAGEITVRPSADDQLHASARFFCATNDDRCRENASRATITHSESDGRSVLNFTPGSAYSQRRANIVYDVQVPQVDRLAVRVPAGDVHIDSPTGCLDAALKAGDLSLRAPLADVRTVILRARVGDASLTLPERGEEGRRPLLVGASVDWERGEGECALRATLLAGDIKARLQ